MLPFPGQANCPSPGLLFWKRCMVDAIVIGAGPNGLVAAAVLARHGWQVLVLEAKDRPGGAVYSVENTLPGYIHDVGAAFFPFALIQKVPRRTKANVISSEFVKIESGSGVFGRRVGLGSAGWRVMTILSAA